MTFTWSPWEWEEVREEGGRRREGEGGPELGDRENEWPTPILCMYMYV